MSSCDRHVYEIGPYQGHRRRELKLFEEEEFSPNSFVLDRLRLVDEEEKELRVIIAELRDLQKISAREMIKSMMSHYTRFIQTFREVGDLEEAILKLRTLLRTRAAVVRSLATEHWKVSSVYSKQLDVGTICYTGEDPIPTKLEKDAKNLPELLDVLMAERQIDQALSALKEGENLVESGFACTNLKGDLNPVTPVRAAILHGALIERRAKLVEYLSGVCKQPSVRGEELRSAIAALNRLGEGTRAHTLLLLAHRGRLEHTVRGLRPSGSSYGGAFTAALSQITFSALSQAGRDSLTVFGAVPAFASELVVWARSVTESYAGRIKQHVLSWAAAAGGLQAAAECVQIAFGHCSLLEAQGLKLCPLLTKMFRPSVEQAMEANLKRIEESVTAMTSADDWVLWSYSRTPGSHLRLMSSIALNRGQGRASVMISSSAHRFNSMAQDFMAGVSPLIGMQLAGVALEGLALRFDTYIDMLIKAVPDNTEDGREQTARTGAQQLALLSNATELACELLPRSAFKLLPGGKESYAGFHEQPCIDFSEEYLTFIPELNHWRQNLIKTVERLRDHACRYHARLLLVAADRSELQISPATYLGLDAEGYESTFLKQGSMPSLVFQTLFTKLIFISNSGEKMALNKERVITPFLARLLEVFVSYLEDDKFWSIIEDGPQRIGPIGLQQFVLDMQFVVQMASSSSCGSRSLHSLVPDLTSRVVHAFAATGADPDSVLPSDDWFLKAAQMAVQKLLEGWNHRAAMQEPVVEQLNI